jgi:hypothetical protein
MKLVNAKITEFKLKGTDKVLDVIKLGSFRSEKNPNNYCKLVALTSRAKLEDKSSSNFVFNRNRKKNFTLGSVDRETSGSLVLIHDAVYFNLPEEAKGRFFIKLSGTRRNGATKDFLCQVKEGKEPFEVEAVLFENKKVILKINEKGDCKLC